MLSPMLQRLSQVQDGLISNPYLQTPLQCKWSSFFVLFLFSLRCLYYATFLKGQEKEMAGREEKRLF